MFKPDSFHRADIFQQSVSSAQTFQSNGCRRRLEEEKTERRRDDRQNDTKRASEILEIRHLVIFQTSPTTPTLPCRLLLARKPLVDILLGRASELKSQAHYPKDIHSGSKNVNVKLLAIASHPKPFPFGPVNVSRYGDGATESNPCLLFVPFFFNIYYYFLQWLFSPCTTNDPFLQ